MTAAYLDLDEAAAFMRITPTALRGLVRRRQIAHTPVNRRPVFNTADLVEYLETHKVAVELRPWDLTEGAIANLRADLAGSASTLAAASRGASEPVEPRPVQGKSRGTQTTH